MPTPWQVAAQGRRRTREGSKAGSPRRSQALRQGKPPFPVTVPGKHVVLAGSGSPAVQAAAITEFGPHIIHVPVGGSVIWYLIGPHSITFNSTKKNDDIRATAPDGSVHLNVPALVPAGGPGEPSKPLTGGSQQHLKFKVVAETRWNGKGFHSSGVFGNSDPPADRGLPDHVHPGRHLQATSARCTTT